MNRRSFISASAAAAAAGSLFPRSWAQGAERSHQPDDSHQPQAGGFGAGGLFYKPPGGRLGDTIPFFGDGQFQIFHLFKADGVRYDTTWHRVATTDFIHFTDCGEALGAGGPNDQDRSVATGSVIFAEGRYHAFYTGFGNPRLTGKPEQGVMHAVSDDLARWTKVPADTFYAPEATYERDDWRDPFVFWNDRAGEYWMLVAARLRSGPIRRRGCTALCRSKDLHHWEPSEPFWAPSLYYTHECPDLFRMGEWWYLIFSEFSETNQTRYRMSRNLTGPWITPAIDTFDTRAFYAGKTASDGRARYLFGWNPLRAGSKDDGEWEWGGNLVVHQLVQENTGELRVTTPETIGTLFERPLELNSKLLLGKGTVRGDSCTIDAQGSFGLATLGPLNLPGKASAVIRFERECHGFGFILHLQDDLDTGYYMRFDGLKNRAVFDLWPRAHDVPFTPGFERRISLVPQKAIQVDIIADGTIAELYVDGQVAMSTRMYPDRPGQAAVFVENGTAAFEGIRLFSAGESGNR